MLLLFPVEPLSEAAVRALVARYGDGDGYVAWVARQRDSDDPDDVPCMGNWRRVEAARRFDDLSVIAAQSGLLLSTTLRLRAKDPAPSDCDVDGWCRCGCGLGVSEAPVRVAMLRFE